MSKRGKFNRAGNIISNYKKETFKFLGEGKSRIEVLENNPREARKALQKLVDAGAYEFSSPINSLSDADALKIMGIVLDDIREMERNENEGEE